MIYLAAVAALAAYLWHRRSHPPGAGASAAARARQLRTPWIRLATLLGISTRAETHARRWDAGSVGEQRTARRLAPLPGEGWTILHDRALPRSRANVDHLCISPHGAVILPDSKLWSSRYRVRVVGGRLLHGTVDVTDWLNGLRYETRTVARLLGVPVIPVVVMHGAVVDGGEQVLDDIRIIPADRLLPVLRALDHTPTKRPPRDLPARATRLLPPYQERR